MRKRPLLLFACVFLIGLTFQRYDSLALIILLLLIVGREIFVGVKHRKIRKMAGRSVLLLSAFILGMTHMQKEEDFRNAYMSKLEDGSDVTVWGEIIKIENTDYGIRMILSDSYISLKEEQMPCNDIMVYASSNHFQVGEIHKITGQLNMFEVARNTGNFDSRVFYQSQKIDFSVWIDSNILLGRKENVIRDALLFLKEEMSDVYTSSMDEKAAGFFMGMILGDKTNLDKEIKDLFELGGISHILAISGLHVSIIGRGLYSKLRKRRVGFVVSSMVSGVLLLAYCYMVGNSMSAVRAVGMMCIFFLGQCLGKSYDMLNALGVMCVILLWENPFLIEYSGFWFSVMALVGVGFVGNALSQQIKKGKRLWMSIGITLSTLPIVACCYYEIPAYSSLVNFIVLPILTPIFCIALFSGIIGIVFPRLAYILLIPCGWMLEFYEWLCTMVGRLPGASIITGKPSVQIIVIYYIVLLVGVLLLKRWRSWAAIGVCICCLLLIIYPKDKPFEITFLDVGQGDGIYISAGDGTTYFIDGGSSSVDSVGEYRILPFLKSKGIAAIDYWFVSHVDSDHISGLLEIIESGYEIKHLVVSKHAPEDEMSLELFYAAQSYGIEVLKIDAGEKIVSENASFMCLYPWNESNQDRNEASLVLELEVNNGMGFRVWFAGDISSETERVLREEGVADTVWLYKASHHGSKYSNSKEILEVLQPEVCVVSCSENNNYGHPAEEAIANMEAEGSQVYYTMKSGQVTIIYNRKKGLVISPFLLLQ